MENLVEKIELHDTLNPKLWDSDNKLDSEVSEKLHEIVDQFILELEENDIPIKVLDAHLVGSNASFNYTDESDLDVHVVANFEDVTCDPIILNLLYNFFKKYFNDKYEISIHGVPVELYVEDVNAATISNGIYSLFNDEWIKFPEPVEVPDIDITDDLEPYEDRYDEIMEERDADKAEELISELYLLRKNALSTEGEYSVGNLVFKEFRNLGYLDELKQLTIDKRTRELSLESLMESMGKNLISLKNIEKVIQKIKPSQYNKNYAGSSLDRLYFRYNNHNNLTAIVGTTNIMKSPGAVTVSLYPKKNIFIIEATWAVEDESDFNKIGLDSKYKLNGTGFNSAIIKAILDYLPNNYSIIINHNLNPHYWNHLMRPYRDKFKKIIDGSYNTEQYTESINDLGEVDQIEPYGVFEACNVQLEEDGDWGYHYGDLGKADYKHQFGNRNTGGFGTGIYFVGSPINQRKDAMGYKERPGHVIDLSKYNLYKPKDNNQAYKLHDALLYLNNYSAATNEVPATWDDILDEYEEVFDEVFLELNSSTGSKPVKLNTAPILRYIRKYIEYYPYKITDVDYDSLRDIAKEIEERRVEESQKFYNAIDNLYSALNYSVGEDRLIKAVKSAIKDTSDIAPATLIMQKLGYDGIDVRHLNKDDQGLQGLDNFGFGSVLYDLKESIEETGRTTIKAVVFHNEDQPKKQIPNFQDFEEDGLYRLGENDYIVFEKRWEEDPRGWGMIHAEVVDDFVIPIFPDYRDKYIEEAGLEIDNLQPNSDLYHDLRKLNTKTFSKYTNIIKRAVDKYFK